MLWFNLSFHTIVEIFASMENSSIYLVSFFHVRVLECIVTSDVDERQAMILAGAAGRTIRRAPADNPPSP